MGLLHEWKRACTEQQEQVKRASNQVRFHDGANSLHQSSPEAVHFTQVRCEMSRLFCVSVFNVVGCQSLRQFRASKESKHGRRSHSRWDENGVKPPHSKARENIRVNWCPFVVISGFANMKGVADFQIRPARVEDVPIILELIRDLATYERAPDEVTATEEQLVDVLFGKRPAAEVLLAFEGKSPVGFAVYFYNFSTWLGRPGLYLEDLFVKPEKRGKGYGLALLVELAKIARDRGCGRMEWAVLNWNEPAIKFYRALGANPMDEWTVFRLTRDGIERLANVVDTPATTEPVEHD
jgi:GNAT superfamily N-acetyltransferase